MPDARTLRQKLEAMAERGTPPEQDIARTKLEAMGPPPPAKRPPATGMYSGGSERPFDYGANGLNAGTAWAQAVIHAYSGFEPTNGSNNNTVTTASISAAYHELREKYGR